MDKQREILLKENVNEQGYIIVDHYYLLKELTDIYASPLIIPFPFFLFKKFYLPSFFFGFTLKYFIDFKLVIMICFFIKLP